MKTSTKLQAGLATLLIGSSLAFLRAADESYESLEGVAGLEVAFDLRLNDPKKTALFLELIHMTYKDRAVEKLTERPDFVVVFNGESVTLISEDQDRFSREDRPALQTIARLVKEMAADGIKIEGCLTAAKIFKVDPALFLQEVDKIDNAWISLAGYQAQGYSNIPIF